MLNLGLNTDDDVIIGFIIKTSWNVVDSLNAYLDCFQFETSCWECMEWAWYHRPFWQATRNTLQPEHSSEDHTEAKREFLPEQNRTWRRHLETVQVRPSQQMTRQIPQFRMNLLPRIDNILDPKKMSFLFWLNGTICTHPYNIRWIRVHVLSVLVPFISEEENHFGAGETLLSGKIYKTCSLGQLYNTYCQTTINQWHNNHSDWWGTCIPASECLYTIRVRFPSSALHVTSDNDYETS